MKLLSNSQLPPIDKTETLFRISHWRGLFAYLVFLLALGGGLSLFVATFYMPDISGFHWSRIVLLFYILLLWFVCRFMRYTYAAVRRPDNWLARIGPHGVFIKYRSYLHYDSPAEDPIAVQLAWHEIEEIQRQGEVIHTSDFDGGTVKQKRMFLTLKLNSRYLDPSELEKAIEFEQQRKPAHFKVDDLKHELFLARKARAGSDEIKRLQAAIKMEKRRHPGKHQKGRFLDRPVLFVKPDTLRVEWSNVTPGRKVLDEALSRYRRVVDVEDQQLHADKPMTDGEFAELLAILINSDDLIEAMKLIRHHRGGSISEAMAFIEQSRVAK